MKKALRLPMEVTVTKGFSLRRGSAASFGEAELDRLAPSAQCRVGGGEV
jgi:hypothetical protein